MFDHTNAQISEPTVLAPGASPDFYTIAIDGVPTTIHRRVRPAPKAEATAPPLPPVESAVAKADGKPLAVLPEVASSKNTPLHSQPESYPVSVEEDADDYEVGFGNPPKDSQFKKGQSGNPSGRPKGSKNASTIATEQLNKKLRVKVDGKSKNISALEIALQQQMKRAAEKSDLKSLGYLLQLAGQGPSAGSGAKGFIDKGLTVEAADPADMAILAFDTRGHILAAGLSQDAADSLLIAIGLKTATEK